MNSLSIRFLFLFAASLLTCQAEDKPKEISYKKLKYAEVDGIAIYKDPETRQPFTGIARDMHPNGQVHMECPFKDGKMNGLVREWFANGKKLAETQFVDGERTGKNTEWTENGELYRERVYDHDKIMSEKNYEPKK